MNLRRCETILLLTFSSVIYGCWPAVGLAAEPPSTQIADSLSDRAAYRVSVIEPSLVQTEPMGAPVPRQIPVGEADGGEQRGHILGPAPRMMSDSTLNPVKNLDPVGVVPAIQSRMLSPTETVDEASASFRSPLQGVMTLDRGYRDAMPGGPPPDHP